jgi:hypothetical protein
MGTCIPVAEVTLLEVRVWKPAAAVSDSRLEILIDPDQMLRKMQVVFFSVEKPVCTEG